jgi:ABC-type multidrug transport system fused ATPase/permease subunit
MNIDQLKTAWQNVAFENLSAQDLEVMTRMNNHPTLRNIRRKLIFEMLSLSLFLFIYYDAFDGDKKPLYINLMLIISVMAYISGNLAGYLLIMNPLRGKDLRQSVKNLFRRIKSIFIFSIISTVVYVVTLVLFFSSSMVFTKSKSAILVVLAFSLIFLFYRHFRRWKNQLDHYKKLIGDFE